MSALNTPDVQTRLDAADARVAELAALLASDKDRQRNGARGGSRAEQDARDAESSPVQREYDRAATEARMLRVQLQQADAQAVQDASRAKAVASDAKAASLEPVHAANCDRAGALLAAFGSQAKAALDLLTESGGELDRAAADAAYHRGGMLHVSPAHQIAARKGLRVDLLHQLAALAPPDA